MIDLSARVEQIVDALFPASERQSVKQLLRTECADNIVDCNNKSKNEMDRIRISALKISNGDVGKLHAAIELAQTDWRDLFMAADFGHDPEAHKSWFPRT